MLVDVSAAIVIGGIIVSIFVEIRSRVRAKNEVKTDFRLDLHYHRSSREESYYEDDATASLK